MTQSVHSNGTASAEPEVAPPEPVYRAHDERRKRAAAGADPTAKLGEVVNRLEEVARQLADVMAGPTPPVAALGSSAAPKEVDFEHLAAEVNRHQEVGRLKRTLRENGDVSYSLPITGPASAAGALVADREAFIAKTRGGFEHLEITGSSDRQIAAAMAFAKSKWAGDDVLIKVGDKHQDRIIRHAVAAGLSIANTEPEIVKAVAKERERQARPPAPEIPQLERVPKKAPAL